MVSKNKIELLSIKALEEECFSLSKDGPKSAQTALPALVLIFRTHSSIISTLKVDN
jgi:hypothetical protein